MTTIQDILAYMHKSVSVSFVVLVAIVALALGAAGAWSWESVYFGIESGSMNGSGPIFTVATSTGAVYFTVDADGKVGIGAENPTALLEVAGPIRLTKKSPDGCSAATEGEIAYNSDNKHFWGCDGGAWRLLDN